MTTTTFYPDITGYVIAPDDTPRRYRIGDEFGEAFKPDDHFEGITLTLELSSVEEGEALVALIDAHGRAKKWPVWVEDETGTGSI